MTIRKFGLFAILIAVAAPAAAQTADQLKARIAVLEKEKAKIQEELRTLRASRPQPVAQNRQVETPAPVRSVERHASPVNAAAFASLPPSVGSWTGFYVGGNVGAAVGKDNTDQTIHRTVGTVAQTTAFESFDLSPQGALAGLQAGFNWQFGRHLVAGAEADFQWTDAKGSVCLGCLPIAISGGSLVYDQSLAWFGTLRARAGWTSGPSLFYVTGGTAYGRSETNLLHTNPIIGQIANARETKWGWTAGGGVESQIAGNLTGKIEYLYLDFGHSNAAGLFDDGVVKTTRGFSSQLHDHVFRTGLNYKFGDPIHVASQDATGSVPVPAAEWSGVYAGVNGGVALARNPASLADQNINLPGFLVDNTQFGIDPVGAFFGGQIGALARLGPTWVAGAEADFQSSHQKDSVCFALCVSSNATGTIFGLPAISIENIAQREEWFATFRGRAGWTSGPTLFYATGGAAVGRVVTDINVSGSSLAPPLQAFSTGIASYGATKWGWTAGGGIESALSANWSIKGEYLYIDLGRVTGSVVTNGGTDTITVSNAVRNHLFRLGLNYRTDWTDITGWN